MAKQADGACLVRFGETFVLVTACFRKEAREGVDFLPLTVDYREYTYAGGRIPGGWFKREGRPTEKEILTARLIDRPLRPLFPKGYTQETQIVGTVLSADGANDPDVLAINGASTALMVSGVPFDTPVGAVRVGMIGDQMVLNPTHEQRAEATLEIVVAGTEPGRYVVVDGHRRVRALKRLKADVAKATVWEMPEAEALATAYQSGWERTRPRTSWCR